MLDFELVSPERSITSEKVEAATLPCMEGELTAMPGHAPFLAALRPGRVTAGDGRWLVSGGFVEITNGAVAVLAEDVAEADGDAGDWLERRIAEAETALETASEDRKPAAALRLNDLRELAGRTG